MPFTAYRQDSRHGQSRQDGWPVRPSGMLRWVMACTAGAGPLGEAPAGVKSLDAHPFS